jgi:hypothetical protein
MKKRNIFFLALMLAILLLPIATTNIIVFDAARLELKQVIIGFEASRTTLTR